MKNSKNILLLFITSFLFSNNIVETGNDHYAKYEQLSPLEMNVEIKLGNFEIAETILNNKTFLKINYENLYPSTIIGSPELPKLNQLIEIPREATIRIEIIHDELVEVDLNSFNNNAKLLPVQNPVSKSADLSKLEFVYDKDVYSENKYIKEEIINVLDKGTLREVRIGNIMFSPFEYNPVSNKLIIHNNVQFKIYFDNANLTETKLIKENYFSPYFEAIYENSLINYESPYSTREDDFIIDPVTYVIVANQAFNGYLDEFINWKTQKGFNVITAYTNEIGSSASSIRAFIQEQYVNPPVGMSPASFVLLVGDTQQLPVSYTSGGHVSDLDYCNFSGSDMPEVLCGRFSAQTPSHLQTQIDKTLEYEQYTMPDPSFLEDVILISGVDSNYAPTYGNGQINYGNNYYFNSNHNIDSNTFLYPASGSSGSQILNLANQGAAFINYTAHGYEQGWADPSFTNSNVNNMTNSNKYPTMVGNCCLTNAFDTGECFGEALLRKNNGGAIGYIGGSDVTYWNEDFWWGVGSGSISSNPSYNNTGEGAYDGMFHENNEDNWAIVNSAVIIVGNLAVEQANGMDDYYWEIYHLMGDPSLSTYLGIPNPNIIEHPVFLSPGETQITINAEPYSYIGLTKDGQLIGSGLVNPFGTANIDLINTNDPGEISIVVTGQNLQPYTGTIILSAPDGPYVTVNNITVNDGIDDIISIGEEVNITITIENVGSENASEITTNLTSGSGSPYISITDGYDVINSLASGESQSINLSFTVNSNAPYGHSFTLSLEIDTESNTYTNNLDFTVENLVESFESGDLASLGWQFSGNENWSIDIFNAYNGAYSAKSGLIDNNMTSEISLTMETVENGNIAFHKKVSCEDVGSYSGNYYDFLAFYIDGIEQAKWAGELDWSQSSFPVLAGEHTFMWKFNKDQGVVAGQDAVWVDNIIFPPTFSDSSSILGDINSDGNINVQDIIILVNIILSSESNSQADVNSDGNIDILDVVVIINIILQN